MEGANDLAVVLGTPLVVIDPSAAITVLGLVAMIEAVVPVAVSNDLEASTMIVLQLDTSLLGTVAGKAIIREADR